MLQSKIALVTGGGRGIGEAVAKILCREGATVIVSDLNQEDCDKIVRSLNLPEDHLGLEIDVSKRTSVTSGLENVLKRYAKAPDVVVHAAGIIKPKTLLKMNDDIFDKVIDVNLKGTYLVNQVFANAMKNQQIKGSIVNISSMAGNIINDIHLEIRNVSSFNQFDEIFEYFRQNWVCWTQQLFGL